MEKREGNGATKAIERAEILIRKQWIWVGSQILRSWTQPAPGPRQIGVVFALPGVEK